MMIRLLAASRWLLLGGIIGLVLAEGAAAASRWDNPPKEKIAGLEHHAFQSASMHASVGYNICFPPEYARESARRFPVIYYLHGYEGNESSFLDYVSYWRDALSRTGPCLLVLVNGGSTSFFSDSPDGSVMGETVVVKELVPEIDRRYRTIAQSPARSVHGYSMGGFGALKLAFKYPDVFGSVVAYGATLSSADEMQKHLGKVYKQMFGNRERFEANNPISLVERNADRIRDAVPVEIIVGTKDEFVAPNRQLAQRMAGLKIQHELVELPGVKHDKEPLYKEGAERAFAWSRQAFEKAKSQKPKSK